MIVKRTSKILMPKFILLKQLKVMAPLVMGHPAPTPAAEDGKKSLKVQKKEFKIPKSKLRREISAEKKYSILRVSVDVREK